MQLKTKGIPVREFFEIEANNLYSKFKAIEALLPSNRGRGASHPAEEGRFVESLIREFLNRHLPKDLIALSGFILRPSTKTGESNYERFNNEYDQHSSQIDIIVFDQSKFPIYEKFEEFGIVPPEGVVAIISVKKTLRMKDIKKELESLKKASLLCFEKNVPMPYTGLFSFSSDFKASKKNLETIKSVFEEEFTNEFPEIMIRELTVLNRFMIFRFRENPGKNEITFVLMDCYEKMHIPMQRLLQSILGIYYKKSLNRFIERPGYISFEEGIHKKAEKFALITKGKEIKR